MFLNKDSPESEVIAEVAKMAHEIDDLVNFFRQWMYRKAVRYENIERSLMQASGELRTALRELLVEEEESDND